MPTHTSPATALPQQRLLSIAWASGVERLDLANINATLAASDGRKRMTIMTTDYRPDVAREVAYNPVLLPTAAGDGGFSLTYTDPGKWLDDNEPADGDLGTATYACKVDKQGREAWTCVWIGKKDDATIRPKCTLSDELAARTYRAHMQAVRDAKFRQLILAKYPACVITGEKEPTVLEAAHIVEVRHGGQEVEDNGITLRADLHKLFDAHKLRLTEAGKFEIDTDLNANLSGYQELVAKASPLATERLTGHLDHIKKRNKPKTPVGQAQLSTRAHD